MFFAVPANSAARSSGEAPAVARLKAFQRTGYVHEHASGGKLISNMQRATPNASMHVSMYGPHSDASCSDDAGGSDRKLGKPANGSASPPCFTATLEHAPSFRMLSRQIGKRSWSFPAYAPRPIGY